MKQHSKTQDHYTTYERDGQVVLALNNEIILPENAPVRLTSAQLEELDYTLEAVPMEYIDGVWTAQVTPVSGVDEMQLTAAAGDGKGNTTFSEPVIVRLALPAALDNIAITGGTIRMGAQGTDVTIDLQNAVGMAPSGTLMVAAYRDNGQLMETVATNIALASGEAKSYSVSLSTSYGEIGYAKAFLIDPSSGYIPECSAERIVK